MTTETTDEFGPDLFQQMDHHEVFTKLRAEDPVHWTTGADGAKYWSLTKQADVKMANADIETFTVTRGFTLIDVDEDPLSGAMMLEMLPGLDPERHMRYRKIVNRGFTPRVLSLLEDHLRLKAKAIVDNVIAQGKADFVDEIAAELPLQAICELVGVPAEDRRRIFDAGNRMTGLDDPNVSDKEQGMTASIDLITYAEHLRELRRNNPTDDIVTKLTSAADGEMGLSDSEFGMFFVLLVVAGNETTRNATAHGMRALLEHPEQLAKLQADPSEERMKRAVEEILRWASPLLHFRRTATKDVELRGKTIKAGDWVMLWYASANRDEEAFDNPFDFDVYRERNDHVTFGGGGAHFCLGANLARLELRLIFTELVTRFKGMQLAGEPEILRSNFVSGIKHMPVTWDVEASA